MELEILKQKETPLLSRKRVTASVTFEGSTPSRIALRDALASKIKSEPKLTVIRHIYQRFGKEYAKIIAHIYSDEKVMTSIEGKKLVDKHTPRAKKEEKKEAPKEEAKK